MVHLLSPRWGVVGSRVLAMFWPSVSGLVHVPQVHTVAVFILEVVLGTVRACGCACRDRWCVHVRDIAQVCVVCWCIHGLAMSLVLM
eukprot:250870-Alexandrium_andersonii.AAC.1